MSAFADMQTYLKQATKLLAYIHNKKIRINKQWKEMI